MATTEAPRAGEVAFRGEPYSNLMGGGGDVIELTAAAPPAWTGCAR